MYDAQLLFHLVLKVFGFLLNIQIPNSLERLIVEHYVTIMNFVTLYQETNSNSPIMHSYRGV